MANRVITYMFYHILTGISIFIIYNENNFDYIALQQ